MATYTVAAGKRAAHDKTLAASVVDSITFSGDVSEIEVISDGTAAIYFTVDDTVAPTVSGDNTELIPAGSVSSLKVESQSRRDTVVKLISAGTPKYSVIGR